MKFLSPFVIRPLHFLFQAHDSILNRTVTILLLVRQQLERVDQVFTKSLRDRVVSFIFLFLFSFFSFHFLLFCLNVPPFPSRMSAFKK